MSTSFDRLSVRRLMRLVCVAVATGVAMWLGSPTGTDATVAAAPVTFSGTQARLQPGIPFMQTKSVTDLTISHLEVTQVIQRWGDVTPLVPLVRGKPTVVRVYVQANGGSGPGPGGTWTVTWTAIDVYHGSTYIDTLWQYGPVIVSPLVIDPKTLRDRLSNTFNFVLPSTWTTYPDGLTLRVTINSQGGVPELNSSNNSVSTTLTFNLTYPLTVAGLMFSDPLFPYPAKPYTDFNTQLLFLNQTWPVPSANLYTPPNPDLHYGVLNGVDPNDPYYPGGGTVATDADKRRLQATDASRGYYWYAMQPWFTGVNGMACGVGTCRGATGQDTTGAYNGTVMAQEIGHNWGQYHTGHVSADNWFDPNCCPHGGISRSTIDLAFGFNTQTMQVIPPGVETNGFTHPHDFMVGGCTGGCPTPPFWVSDYTYERLLNADRVLRQGLRPTDVTRANDGDQHAAALPVAQQYMFVGGRAGDSPGLDPPYVLDQSGGSFDQTGEGELTLELLDETDQVLSSRSFDPLPHTHDLAGPPTFLQVLPWDANAHSLVLRNGDDVVAKRVASPNPPTVSILTPRPGVHWNGARQVTWEASDPDGDDLVYAVHYSSDGGRTWLPVGVDLTGTSLDIDAGLLRGSIDCRVRVIASDGFNTTIAESEPFGVDRHEPLARMLDEPQMLGGRQVILRGAGYDADDGQFSDESLVWESDRDGILGSGTTLVTPPLSVGHHVIRLQVKDSDGNSASSSVVLDMPSTPIRP